MTQATLSEHLDAELDWLAQVIESAIRTQLGDEDQLHIVPEPPLLSGPSEYAELLIQVDAGVELRLFVILALAPALRPGVLDALQLQNPVLGRRFSEFGGTVSSDGAFLPTVETALFLVADSSTTERLRIGQLVASDQPAIRHNLLTLGPASDGPSSAPLLAGSELIASVLGTQGKSLPLTADFLGQRLHTALGWNDLVLSASTLSALEEIVRSTRVEQEFRTSWAPSRRIRPGYLALFSGPPGTGKTLAATLVGQKIHTDVYRVDLSLIVSKRIGETERNLDHLLSMAERQNWILFFDEADALYGKRTQAPGANDRHANQQVSNILQQINGFAGVAFMATNATSTIHDAFLRIFQSIVHFALPGPLERLTIWQNAFKGSDLLADDVGIEAIADQHELSGGAIVNVVHTARLRAVSENRDRLTHADLQEAIEHEYRNEA